MFALIVRPDNTCDHLCARSNPLDLSGTPHSTMIVLYRRGFCNEDGRKMIIADFRERYGVEVKPRST